MSAHADRDEIIEWLKGFEHKPANIFLVHGETRSATALSALIKERLELSSYLPRYADTVTFKGRTWQVAPSTTVPAPEPAVRELQEYLNELDNGLTAYKLHLEQVAAADAAKMPIILERLQKIRKFAQKTLEDI